MIVNFFTRIAARLLFICQWHWSLVLLAVFAKKFCHSASLCGAKVLVVGTGPSLDRLAFSALAQYDWIFAINAAINHPYFAETHLLRARLGWFSSDPHRVVEFSESIKLKSCFTAFYTPFFPYSALNLALTNTLSRLVLVRPKFMIGEYFKLFSIKMNLFDRPAIATEKIELEIQTCLSSGRLALPHVYSSSAIPLLIMLGWSNVLSIDLIGCDFTNGRSLEFISLGPASFSSNRVVPEYMAVAGALKKRGIHVDNLSWK